MSAFLSSAVSAWIAGRRLLLCRPHALPSHCPVFPGKRFVLYSNTYSYQQYDLSPLNATVYADPRYIFALVGTDTYHWRKETDISMPLFAPTACCDLADVRRSFERRLEDKTYFASFLGSFHRSPVRTKLYNLANNNKSVIIGKGHIKKDGGSGGFYSMMYDTVFNLILRGDTRTTFRFSEAVCSGGIPVLITDALVPPFEQLIPFESYGILHDENDLESLMQRLRQLPQERREALRRHAFEVCQTFMASWQKQMSAVGRILGGVSFQYKD
eukprot:TRINITY_DN65803_c0_g1_i10.p2 TRINITY_DN65803_c0_g1~~TRINITY_DN65803_c0_g1_i10.p2  ORF type:complete len:271 (-),score=8.38 TRINITY_DN65803_c0_g1_i10:163-975(-)